MKRMAGSTKIPDTRGAKMASILSVDVASQKIGVMRPLDSRFGDTSVHQPPPRTTLTLTSWKEIAGYVGKGVRTVQRWERTLNFPIRRPHGRIRSIVLAFPDEIDSWLHSRFTPNGVNPESELKRLQQRVDELVAENKFLRSKLKRKSTMP